MSLGFDCRVSSKNYNCTSYHDEYKREIKLSGYCSFCKSRYVISRNSTHSIVNNPQTDIKTLESFYPWRSMTFYATVHVRLDRPCVTVHTSIFKSSITTHFYQFWRRILIEMIQLNCVYFGSVGVRHIAWTVTYVTVHRVPTVRIVSL